MSKYKKYTKGIKTINSNLNHKKDKEEKQITKNTNSKTNSLKSYIPLAMFGVASSTSMKDYENNNERR
jgi:hypothetical protein